MIIGRPVGCLLCNKPNGSGGGVVQGNSSGGYKYWSDSVDSLEPEPTGLSDRFKIGVGGAVKERGAKEHSRIY